MSITTSTTNATGTGDARATKPMPPQYQLLSSITVPPGIKINPKGLVLIVGPNSAWKTQLLKDIPAVLIGQARDLVVCSDYQLAKPQSEDILLESLVAEGFLRKHRDVNGNECS